LIFLLLAHILRVKTWTWTWSCWAWTWLGLGCCWTWYQFANTTIFKQSVHL